MKKLLLLTVLLSSWAFGDGYLTDTVCVDNQLHAVHEGILFPVYDLSKTYQVELGDKIVDVFVVKECE